jgi:ribosomal protein S12 methylthiotransferase accessory factor YcaO
VFPQDRLEAQVQFMRDELTRKEAEHAAAMEALERKFLEDKSRVLKAHAESFQEARRRAREDAQKQLDTDTKRIILDNKRMVSTCVC